ncbi:DUF4403 family protein [Sandaracinus amylolyticus]|uniref:DUF4403 family protein n=1 Tax=Sandaracinus amylolyticus TaxID=927083 RepID=UPI001F460A8A|nr:DUF4403 family protein [Sandaracinus amylolyticus]
MLILTCGSNRRVDVAADVRGSWQPDWSLQLSASLRDPVHIVGCDPHLENEGWLTAACVAGSILTFGAGAAPFCAAIPTVPRLFTPAARRGLDRALARALEQGVERANDAVRERAAVRDHVEPFWQSLVRPRQLELVDGAAWLRVVPTSVAAADPWLEDGAIRSRIAITGRAQWSSAEPSATPEPPIPLLQRLEPGASEALSIAAAQLLPWNVLTREANRVLAGQRFPPSGTPFACAARVVVANDGSAVAVQLDLGGTISGRVIVLGDLDYDPAAREVRLTNLRFRDDSAAQIRRAAGQVDPDALLVGLVPSLRWPVGAHLDRITRSIEVAFESASSDAVHVDVSLDPIRVDDLAVSDAGIHVRASILGHADVAVVSL